MAWKWRALVREEWAEASELLGLVAVRYPVLTARPAKPLAIGTSDRLKVGGAEIGLTEDQVNLVMVRLTRALSYLAALARGGPRYDLDGGISGEVSAKERKWAASVLTARRKRRAKAEAAIACVSGESDQPIVGDDGSAGAVQAGELRDADAGEASNASEAGSTDDRAAA
ncbi:MAG: ProQ/FINO family protein [Acidiphilium sp.]|nr:ProQ/FINO family protein [Acidiphilium sp.]MDD4936862.1 ProQ/FINO family protein [Acidiphilium sp.]